MSRPWQLLHNALTPLPFRPNAVNPSSPLNTIELASYGPVIPVIVIHELAHAVPLARALVAGGVRVLEVTLRTPVALQAMQAMVAEVPEAIVGAGTLRTAADVEAACAVGCRFGVSPGYTASLGQACSDAGLPLLPGVATASEVMAACDKGLRLLKFFPASAAGGVPMLKALAGPFPDVAFCPTGGITPQNAPEFLALPQVKVVGGSWLSPAALLQVGDWEGITRLARAASALSGA